MDDVWCAPGLTRRDFETFLGALALHGEGQPPLLAVARDDEGASEVLMASRALFALFGVTDGAALAGRLLSGSDPGARRLATLCQTLPLRGAPRLERLRFFIGPGSEVITFLCRRIPMESGRPVFLAAALGVRAGLVPEPPQAMSSPPAPAAPATPAVPASVAPPIPAAPMNIETILSMLKQRYPATRTMRFLWQTDADLVCTLVTPRLGDVVGSGNGDLVGRNLVDLAPLLDPSGHLATALATRATWSGLDVAWPISDAPATVAVGLGAIPVQDRGHGFEGYRGYGVIHLDRILSGDAIAFPAPATSETPIETADVPPTTDPDNVVPFPPAAVAPPSGSVKALSAKDQEAFDALRVELREEAGLNEAELPPLADMPAPAVAPVATRNDEIGRNAAALFERLAVGILVSRANVPIFANRHLLDKLGFADEDALHAAGGVAHLFGDVPAGAATGVRTREGVLLPVSTRVQSVDWDGLPATLLTLHPQTSGAPVETVPSNAGETRELRAIIETATDGVAVMDADCNIVSLNRSGEALFGCERASIVGKPFLDLFAAENQALVSDYLEGLKSNSTKSLLNDGRDILINVHQDGKIPVFMTLGRLDRAEATGSHPKQARFCALFRDLTHWKKIEQELGAARQIAEDASARKTDFLAKVSHELRTPLNAIIGFADVIMDERLGPIGNERYKDYLRDIHASGTHVLSLVNDLLDLSKIEAGKMQLAEAAIDVNKIVNETVSLMQAQASRERVILRLSLAPHLPQIKADERSLRQIVLNILSNAVKFNEPGGQVIIATATTDTGQVVIRIRDTGHGMSDEDIAAALEPFRPLSTTRATEGTGLGLPLTKALVEANQGALTIKSKRDHGTLVEVAFPPARVLAG